MSYTLTGRLQTRLAAAVLPFLAAAVLAPAVGEWWPLELAGCMIGVGLALDALLYHRLLAYQPGWAALPLGLLELASAMLVAWMLSVGAPLSAALAFFGSSWLIAQVLAHAGLPLLRLSYVDDGGELGRVGVALPGTAAVALLVVTGAAWSMQPPTYRLASGVHKGPLVLDTAQRLVGERGAIVDGGIVITGDDVVVRDVTVRGGEHGITVDDAEAVVLDRVTVEGAELDGINVRRSAVTIRDCEIRSLPGAYVQGIDISFSFDRKPSLVEGCTINGGLEGIVIHFSRVMVRDNRVRQTELRAITMTEMSMGSVEENDIAGARGVGIFCGDYSHCEIDDNTVADVRPDRSSDDATRQGVAIQSHFWATAEVGANSVARSPGGIAAFTGGTIERE